MFAVDVCLLPATGGTTGIAVAALVLLVLGVVVARWVRASAGRLSVVATVPILLMALVGASAPSVECAQELLAPTTTVAPTTTGAPTTTTTVVPVDPNLVLQIDTSMQPGLGGASIGSMAASGSVSTATTYIFELGLFGDVNVSIDWGDNTTSVATTAGVVSHTYATSGKYAIRISGSLTAFGRDPSALVEPSEPEVQFEPAPLIGAEYLVGVSSFGDLGLTNLDGAFWTAFNLVSVPSVLPSTVVSMSGMFAGATSFNQNLSSWDTGNVTDMSGMFGGAESFNQSLSTWDTGSVTDMNGMFYYATSFNQSLSSWNVSLVTDMEEMLDGTALSTANYSATLIGWASRSVKPNVQLGASGLAVVYETEGCDAHQLLDTSWTISDSSVCINP